MKCIIVGPAYPLRGGIANLNESLCTAFHKEGIESEIVSFSLQYPSLLFPGKTQYVGEKDSKPNVKVHSIINSIQPFTWWKAAQFIKKQKPDFVVMRYWLPFMAPSLGSIARLLRKSGIKVIAITDNIIPHEKRIGDTALTSYFVNSCDAFVVMSKSVLADIATFTDNPNKVFIPHPIYDVFGKAETKEVSLDHLKLDKNNKYLLFFGFIRKYKGLDLLLKALALLPDKQVKLIVAGEFYENKEQYLSLIDELKLKDRVIIHDQFIPNEEVKYYFGACDLVTQTYHSATQSGVTQIAFHFEKPMLVTDVGGLSEVIRHNESGYVCPHDEKIIADCITDFYTQNRETTFSAQVAKDKHLFTWKNMVDGIVALKNSIS